MITWVLNSKACQNSRQGQGILWNQAEAKGKEHQEVLYGKQGIDYNHTDNGSDKVPHRHDWDWSGDNAVRK